MHVCVCLSMVLPFVVKAFEEDDFGATEGIPTRQGIVDILLEIMVGDRKSFTVSVQVRSVHSRICMLWQLIWEIILILQ